MKRHVRVIVGWVGLAVGCAAVASCAASAVQRCLEAPVSSKVSAGVLRSCEAAVVAAPERWDVFQRYARLLLARGHYREVVSKSQEVLAVDPARADARYLLAVGLRKLGRCDEAVGEYRAYAKQHPNDPDPFFGIALCGEARDDSAGALAAYRDFVKKVPSGARPEWTAQARRRIVALSAKPAQPATQPAVAAKAKAPKPTKAPKVPPAKPVVVAPSTPSAAPSAPPKAKPKDCSDHEQAIAANPFDTDAYDRFAACATSQGQHERIIQRMRIALRDNPDYPRGWLHLALAHHALGRHDDARRALSRACAGGITEACAK